MPGASASEPLDWPFTRAEALARHNYIARELGTAHRELSTVRAAEREAKINSFQATAGTDKAREQAASFNGFPNTRVVWEIEGNIRALEEERDDIRWQLTNNEELA